MSEWTGGYVADLEYTSGFYREQSPTHLNLSCLVAGVEGVPIDREFAYCELGCGQGFTATLLAAANPQGRFHAIDFNPAHIARARALAAEAGLTNIRFHERSFAELAAGAESDLPEFDFVTLHGVYSWISVENRHAIVDFLRRRVRPGGIVYVSYNTMPGWAPALPIQRLIYDCANLMADRSDRKVTRAVAFVEQLRDAGALSLQDNPFLSAIVNAMRNSDHHYVAHEYLSEHWIPRYHADVARELADAKLSFIGSANLLYAFPDLVLAPPQRELLSQIAVPEVQETLKDYCVSRRFRRDVFLRGARRLRPVDHDTQLRQVRLALVIPRALAQFEVMVPRGEASMEPRVYGPMLDALAEAPRTVGELLDLPEVKGRTKITPLEVVGMLVGSEQCLPIIGTAGPEGGDSVRRFNLAIARGAQRAETNSRLALAAAPLGSGVYASVVELVTYFGVVSGAGSGPEDIAPLIWEPIAARGEKLIRDGRPVEDEAESLALIREEVAAILRDKLPLWRSLGAI